mmetsp:Transcript_160915/g.516443  ORF Transcript_160915/g.516443 Transcript_160915/m.516443 type:complete len:210 (-) Transcript_160915:3-632(-)
MLAEGQDGAASGEVLGKRRRGRCRGQWRRGLRCPGCRRRRARCQPRSCPQCRLNRLPGGGRRSRSRRRRCRGPSRRRRRLGGGRGAVAEDVAEVALCNRGGVAGALNHDGARGVNVNHGALELRESAGELGVARLVPQGLLTQAPQGLSDRLLGVRVAEAAHGSPVASAEEPLHAAHASAPCAERPARARPPALRWAHKGRREARAELA